MFHWIKRFFVRSDADSRRKLYDLVDEMNSRSHCGPPLVVESALCKLELRSGRLSLGDPQDPRHLIVSSIKSESYAVEARMWKYPDDSATVIGLRVLFEPDRIGDLPRTIGSVPIDSARLVIGDEADIKEHFHKPGKERTGLISNFSNDKMLRKIVKKFKLRTVQHDPFNARIVGPISEALEGEITAFVSSFPEHEALPFMVFRVETLDAFQRVVHMKRPWAVLPVGNDDYPVMFACDTGRGDGNYEVKGSFEGDVPLYLTIDFVDERESPN